MGRKEPRRLGKGLGALLGDYVETPSAAAEGMRELPVSRIEPNPFQPRREFSPEAIAELAHSISENGLLHPVVVRPVGEGWQLVSGDRRLRAVKKLGWAAIPAVVRSVDDRAMLVLALVENLQRDDLSPLEEAEGYRQLMEEFGLTQKEVAERMGRDRSTIANAVRLLSLPSGVRRLVEEGRLTAGHARALLGLSDERLMIALAKEAAEKGLSVRDVEDRVRVGRGDGQPRRLARPAASTADPQVRRITAGLGRAFGTAVQIRLAGKGSGRIEIPFRDPQDFERILERLVGPDEARRMLE